MSPRTIYLSRLIGTYSVLIALAMVSHKEASLQAVSALVHDSAAVELTAVLALAAGLAIVLGHNVWSGGALPVIVTLVGWGSLAKGLFFAFLPPAALASFFDQARYERFFFVNMGVTFVLGAYLTYGGFTAKPR